MAKKQEKEVERWVTVNGARVPIFKDGSIGGPKELRDKLKTSKDKKSSTSGSKERLSVYERQLAEVNDELAYAPKSKALRNEEAIKELEKKKAQLEGYIAKEKAIPTKKETNGETKHYSVYQPKNILGDETHTRLERIEAKSEAEAVAKYKEKYPKASDESIGISRTTKEGGRYQNPDGSWDDGHMYKTSASKTPEFKNAEEAEKYYQEKFNNVSSTYANKLATQMGIKGRGKEKRVALAKAYTEKWKQSQNISNNEDLKEKQMEKAKMEKLMVNDGLSEKEARTYLDNERKMKEMRRELEEEMSSSGEGKHSVNWRREQQDRISKLSEENWKIRAGEYRKEEEKDNSTPKYKIRDDYENADDYRKGVLRKQFENNKNPYKTPAPGQFFTNEQLKERQAAAENWEKERKKYMAAKEKKAKKPPMAKEFGAEPSSKSLAEAHKLYNKKMSGDGYNVVAVSAGYSGDYVTTPSGAKYTIVKSSWNDTYYIYTGRGRTDERPTMDKFNSSKEALEWLKKHKK